MSFSDRTFLLIISGGIAAYKSLDLIRELRRQGARVIPLVTQGGQRFVTPLSLAALSGEKVASDLFDQDAESDMRHIRLARMADLIIVCPASANMIARMAAGRADDLASAILLASESPILVAPAMNPVMWRHPATRRNIAQLQADGVHIVPPDKGEMACGETGWGRLPENATLITAIEQTLGTAQAASANLSLAGKHAIVTAGPTREPIDPVRYLSNHSSGKQGFAMAAALARLGARVTLVAGPCALATPPHVMRIDVTTAQDMAGAVQAALPADIAVMVAAVADWRVAPTPHKMKKGKDAPQSLHLIENPDILSSVASGHPRPRLVVGFAAETENLIDNAIAKRARKKADWILANDVSRTIFDADHNHVCLISDQGTEDWGHMTKNAIADALAQRIADVFA